MKSQKLNPLAFAYTLALLSSLGMLLAGIAGNLGFYSEAVQSMMKWHMFFNLSVIGIIGGMIEASVWSFLIGWLVIWTYNKLA